MSWALKDFKNCYNSFVLNHLQMLNLKGLLQGYYCIFLKKINAAINI